MPVGAGSCARKGLRILDDPFTHLQVGKASRESNQPPNAVGGNVYASLKDNGHDRSAGEAGGLSMFTIVIFGALLIALLVAPLAARERPVAPY